MNITFKTVSIIGLGYIGLPTAALLAANGYDVHGVDIDLKTIELINQGKVHIVEPGLEKLVEKAVFGGKLRATNMPVATDVFIITVPTPFKYNYQPDLSYVDAATKSISTVLKKNDLIILESTSPVGTTKRLAKQLASLRPDLIFPQQNSTHPDVCIAYCPERVMPGKIIHELTHNDRIIGGMSTRCKEKAQSFYQSFVQGACIMTDSKTAEMVKLTENAYRDVNIAFANELSLICDELGIHVWELIALANHHPRVNILQPGPGVGGHCIAVDPWFIVSAAPQTAKLIRTAREVNDNKPQFIIKQLMAAASTIPHPVIACLGLAYKANTDDLRESPVMKIMQHLALYTDYKINIVEPHIDRLPLIFADNQQFSLVALHDAIRDSDIVMVMVDHAQFNGLIDFDLSQKLVIQATQLSKCTVRDVLIAPAEMQQVIND